MTDLDLSQISEKPIEEIHRQGETLLQATVQLAIAADQRATTMAGILGAGAIALLGAAATLVGTEPLYKPLIYALLIASAPMFIGMICCTISSAPVKFMLPGYEPRLLALSASDRTWMLRYASEDLQKRIDKNRRELGIAGMYFIIGFCIGLAGPMIGLAAYVAFYF